MRRRSLVFLVALLCVCALPGEVLCDGDNDPPDISQVGESACREFGYTQTGVWNVDHDCCAPKSQSACADGYDHSFGNECYGSGSCVAYETVCTGSGNASKTTMFANAVVYECEPDDVGPMFLGGALFPIFLLCALAGCYRSKSCCFSYRRQAQFGGMGVQPGVQLSAPAMAMRGYPQQPQGYGQPPPHAQYPPQYAQYPPQYGGQYPQQYGNQQPQAYGQPVNSGYVVHQATVQPPSVPLPQTHAGYSPQTTPGYYPSLDSNASAQSAAPGEPGVVRYGNQSKVPMV